MGSRAHDIRERLLEQARRAKENPPRRTLVSILEDFARDTDRLMRVESFPAR
ncbi:MAG: hypothetical protein GF355_17295, partial [Candidatus Eisenbacteria bacterium]|nr:hypothetical protein [Candidatus Eisenbacteria bacterium]